MPEEQTEKLASKSRLEALSDGLFAIVLTLLVFDLIPLISGLKSEAELHSTFLSVWPKFVSFVISFIVISVIWVSHHTYMNALKGVDEVQLWLNLALLFCISLIPFSASLIGEHHTLGTAGIVYGLNLAITSMVLQLNPWYALSRNLMVGIDPRGLREMKLRTGIFVVSSLIGVVVACFFPLAAFYIYVVNAFTALALQFVIRPMRYFAN